MLTQELKEERQAGHRIYNPTFGEPPYANLANTNVMRHAGRILALYEGGCPYELDGALSMIGPCTFDGQLTGALSAHPKMDPLTGEMLAVNYDLEKGTLEYLRVNAASRVDRQLRFASPWATLVHDIGITSGHVVAFVCPMVFDFSRGPAAPAWEPQRGTRILLIPRDCTDPSRIKWIEADPFFLWHIANAHEQDGVIEAVMPWYDSYAPGRSGRMELHKLRIHTDSGKVEDIRLDDRRCEFSRVHDAWLGRRTRYCYVGLRDPRADETPQPGAFEAFARYDMDTGAKTVYRLGPGQTACEPVFARDLEAGPVARVRLPRRVPAGLHGSWMPT